MACMSKKCALITLWTGVILLVVFIAFISIFGTIYSKIFHDQTQLTDNSIITNIWKDIPMPIVENVYFFNITNGDAFLKLKEPLNVTEVGPYTYLGRWVKKKPIWNDNGTVSYQETRTYQFDLDRSVGSQDDYVYTLNGPMIMAADILKGYNIFVRLAMAVAMGLTKEKIIIKRKIRELVYEGYEDPIIKYAPLLKPDIPFKDGVFSWLYGKNATEDGVFTVFTGTDDASQKGLIDKWNGLEKLNFWKGDTCNMLNGTSIEVGPALESDAKTYSFYQTLFCRSLTFNFTEDVKLRGVPLKRFKPTYMLYANSSENPDNKCFELSGSHPSGILDISPCQFGAPAFLSNPHFFRADPSYLNNIVGLSPNENLHDSVLEVEPKTGFSAHIDVKLQLNIKMERVRGLIQFDNVPEGIFPVLWAGISAELDDHWAHYLLSLMKDPQIVVYSLVPILIVVCIVLIVISAVMIRRHNKMEDEEKLLKDGKDDPKDVSKNLSEPIIDSQNNLSKENSGITNKGLDLSSESTGNENVEVKKDFVQRNLSEESS